MQPGTRLWLDAGDQEEKVYPHTLLMRDTLHSLGLQEPDSLGFYIDHGASHNEGAWAARVHRPLQYFFSTSR